MVSRQCGTNGCDIETSLQACTAAAGFTTRAAWLVACMSAITLGLVLYLHISVY